MSDPKQLAVTGRRMWCAVLAGLLGYCIAKALGVPDWRDGWDVGDRFDIAILSAFLAWNITALWSAPQ